MNQGSERGPLELTVGRLRRYAGDVCLSNPAEMEAAALLEEQAAEIERLRAVIEDAASRLEELDEENAQLLAVELREELTPNARLSRHAAPGDGKND